MPYLASNPKDRFSCDEAQVYYLHAVGLQSAHVIIIVGVQGTSGIWGRLLGHVEHLENQMSWLMRLWYLSHRQIAKAQASLRILARAFAVRTQ